MGAALFWLFSHPPQFRQNCSAVLPDICKASNSITWGHTSPSEPPLAHCCCALWALPFTLEHLSKFKAFILILSTLTGSHPTHLTEASFLHDHKLQIYSVLPGSCTQFTVLRMGEMWNLKLFLQGVRMTANITAVAAPNSPDLTLRTTVQSLPSHKCNTFTFCVHGMMLERTAISLRFVLKHSPFTNIEEGRMDPLWPDMNNSVANGEAQMRGSSSGLQSHLSSSREPLLSTTSSSLLIMQYLSLCHRMHVFQKDNLLENWRIFSELCCRGGNKQNRQLLFPLI